MIEYHVLTVIGEERNFCRWMKKSILDPHGEMVQMHKCGFYPLGTAIEVGGDFNL